jgi:hypothetical protein
VIGCGINLLMPDELEAQIGRKWPRAVAGADGPQPADGRPAQPPGRRAGRIRRHRLRAVRERWNALHAWQGKDVVLLDDGAVLQQGRAAGVDAIGRLLLDTGRPGRNPVRRRLAAPLWSTNMILLIDAGNTRVKWALVAPAHGALGLDRARRRPTPTRRNWNWPGAKPPTRMVSAAS